MGEHAARSRGMDRAHAAFRGGEDKRSQGCERGAPGAHSTNFPRRGGHNDPVNVHSSVPLTLDFEPLASLFRSSVSLNVLMTRIRDIH